MKNKNDLRIEYLLNSYLYEVVGETETEEEHAKAWNEAKSRLVQDYGETALRGYGIFVSGVNEMPLLHIERIDELDVYADDLEASEQAEKDGIKILETHFANEPFCYYNGTIIDTEENRKRLENIQAENEYFR